MPNIGCEGSQSSSDLGKIIEIAYVSFPLRSAEHKKAITSLVDGLKFLRLCVEIQTVSMAQGWRLRDPYQEPQGSHQVQFEASNPRNSLPVRQWRRAIGGCRVPPPAQKEGSSIC